MVQRDGRLVTVAVTADGDEQTVKHVGAALLIEMADRLGPTRALSAGLAAPASAALAPRSRPGGA